MRTVCARTIAVKKMPLRKKVNVAQGAQANTNGYFGGYIGKAQPAGHMEIKNASIRCTRYRIPWREKTKLC